VALPNRISFLGSISGYHSWLMADAMGSLREADYPSPYFARVKQVVIVRSDPG
jgi:hypothetical protein